MRSIPDYVSDILICPKCHSKLLADNDDNFICHSCSEVYGFSESGSLDLRLKSEKAVIEQVILGKNLSMPAHLTNGSLVLNPNPQVDFSGFVTPRHLTRELLSYFPKASGDHSMILDLGCGDTVHREVCEHAGFEYIGLDFSNEKAPYLGDGHALPFRDGSFDFALMIAVLEHIQYPLVLMSEVKRVLRPGGTLIGTVSFLEPFHENSLYHHTHLGLYNDLSCAGFEIEQLSASKEWQVFDAQAKMAGWIFFPGMPKPLRNGIIRLPKQLSHWWYSVNRLIRKKSLPESISNVTGAFTFIAKKPAITDTC